MEEKTVKNRIKKLLDKKINLMAVSEKAKVIIAITAFVLATGIGAGSYFLVALGAPAVNHVITLEAGSNFPDADIFLKDDEDTAEYITDISGFDLSKPQIIELILYVNGIEHEVILEIHDTIPPEATPVINYIAKGEILTAEDFVTNIIDETEVTVNFIEEPDFEEAGHFEVAVILEDEGKNTTELLVDVYIYDVSQEGITVEAGASVFDVRARDFVAENEALSGMYDKVSVKFETSVSQRLLNSVGEYEINIILNSTVFTSMLTVVDTTPPVATLTDVEIWQGQTAEPMDFIEDVLDYSEFTVEFLEEPDFKALGEQDVTLILEDIWGNSATYTSTLNILKNTTPPVIRGAKNITVGVGGKVLYREGISAWSNVDGNIRFDVDNKAVNLNEVGRYPVIYTAVDSGGLKTTVTIYITVVVYNRATVYDLADAVLARLGTASMGQREKVNAIHSWVRNNIRYGSNTEYDRLKAAFNGFQRRIGNCYTYYAVSSVLMERAGITNQRIVRTPGARATNHSWNLVNIGGLWYHYDANPNRFGLGALFTSADALRISTSVMPGYFTYNPSLYPPIVGQSANTVTDTGSGGDSGGGADHGSTSAPDHSSGGTPHTPVYCAISCGVDGCTAYICPTSGTHTCTCPPPPCTACGTEPCICAPDHGAGDPP